MSLIRALVTGRISLFLLVWKETIDCLVPALAKFLHGRIRVHTKRGLMPSQDPVMLWEG